MALVAQDTEKMIAPTLVPGPARISGSTAAEETACRARTDGGTRIAPAHRYNAAKAPVAGKRCNNTPIPRQL